MPEPDPIVQEERRPPAKRRRRRILLIAAGALALLVAVVAAALPSLLTSRWAERKIEAVASEKIGRPVQLGDVRFGWRKPLSIERVHLPAVEGEGEFAALLLQDVSVPLSLGRLLKGTPLDLSNVHVGRIETNLVRRADGSWNWLSIAEHAAGDEPKPEKPKKEPPDKPSPLPLRNLKVTIESIDVRVVDPAENFVAGWEGGRFEAHWPGGAQPLTVDVAGELRMNDERLAWNVRAKLADWIDANGMLTADTAAVTISSGGMIDERQIAGGGFFVHATAREAERNVVRVLLPLGELRRFAAAAPLPDNPPPIHGSVDWTLGFAHANSYGEWTFDTSLSVDDIATTVTAGEQHLAIPPQRIEATATGAVDLRAERVVRLTGNLASEFASAGATIANLPFREPLAAESLDFRADADFGKATQLAAAIFGARGEPLLEGTIALAGERLGTDPSVPSFRFRVDFLPESLRTLQPFAEDPAFLREGPLPLAPFGFSATIAASYDQDSGVSRLRIDDWRSDWLHDFVLEAEAATQPLAWTLDTRGAIDLTAPFEAYGGRFAAPHVRELEGALAFDLAARQQEEGAYATAGSVTLNGFRVLMERFEQPLAEERLDVAWDVTAKPESGEFTLARVNFATSFLSAELTGTVADRFDVRLNAETDLDELMRFAEPAAALEAQVGGTVALSLQAQGAPGREIALGAQAASEELFYAQPGVVRLRQPLEIALAAEIAFADEAPARGVVDLSALQVGSLFEGSFRTEFDLTGADGVRGALTAALDYAALLETIDPAMLAGRGLDIAADGATELHVEFAGPLAKTGDGAIEFPGRWTAEGEVLTEFPAIEWQFGEMAGYLEGLFDERRFTLAFAPDNSTSPTYRDEASSGVDYVEGPAGVVLHEARLSATTDAGLPDRAVYLVRELSIAETQWIGESVKVELPSAIFSGAFIAHLAESLFEANDVSLAVRDAAELRTNTTFDWSGGSWTTSANLRVHDLVKTLRLADTGEEPAPWMETLGGTMMLVANLHSHPPDAEAGGLPLAGNMRLEWEDIGFRIPRRMTLRGMGGSTRLAIEPGTGELSFSAEADIQEFYNTSLEPKPLAGVQMALSGNMARMDDLRVTFERLAIANYLLESDGFMEVRGLQAFLADREHAGAGRALRNLLLDGELRVRNDLAGLSGVRDPLAARGQLDLSLFLRSNPATSLQFTALTDLRGAGVQWADLFGFEGANGAWEAGKTLLLTPQGRPPTSPPAGEFVIDRVTFGTQMFRGALGRSRFTVRGIEDGLTVDFGSRDVLGGTSRAYATLVRDAGDPLLAGRLEVTGLDLARLASASWGGEAGRADELNATGTMRWRLRENAGARFLDSMSLEMQSTRIGQDAFRRLLQALDADQDDPRFQNAILALRFGAPVATVFRLENSLATFRTELRLPGGVRSPLPILERQPLGDLMEVYSFDEFGPLVDLTRWGLLLLLAPDLETLEQTLAQRTEAN